MNPVQGAIKPALTGLEKGAETLAVAAAELKKAAEQIEAANGPATGAKLLTEEVRDILVRVKAEREKLLSTLPDF